MELRTGIEKRDRVTLTRPVIENFFEHVYKGTVNEFCTHTGLSYTLVYNLVHGRIHSLSARDYRIIFGEDPPPQIQKRVHGRFFRDMVNLWLFLNDQATKADLYKEFYPNKSIRKIDYRIFNGNIKTIDPRLEKIMEKKFADHGLDRFEIAEWVNELKSFQEERVPFKEVQPLLEFIKDHLDVNPSRILNQSFARYESGELSTISKKIHEAALDLKKKLDRALSSDAAFEKERLREGVYGKKPGLVLFTDIEEELKFLKRFTGRGFKRYLGRSPSTYRRKMAKRIASWRTEKIKKDCEIFINKNHHLPMNAIPLSSRKRRMMPLISVLRKRFNNKVQHDLGLTYVKSILSPSHYGRYDNMGRDPFTRIDRASNVLGMSRKAFDLMISENCDIIKRIGMYDRGWYLPDLYLKELVEKKEFDLLKAKYELLAGNWSKARRRKAGFEVGRACTPSYADDYNQKEQQEDMDVRGMENERRGNAYH